MVGVPRRYPAQSGPGLGPSLAAFWGDVGPAFLRDMQTLPERAGSALMQPIEALDRFGRTLTGQEGGYGMEMDASGRIAPSQQLFDDAATLGGFAQMNPAVPGNAFGMGFKAYHGTPHSFDKFEAGTTGNYGPAAYFHESADDAARYRPADGGNIYEADIELAKPFDMEAPVAAEDAAAVLEALGKHDVAAAVRDRGTPIRTGSELWYWVMGQGLTTEEKAAALKRAGFDGVIGDPGREITGKSTRSREHAVYATDRVKILGKLET